MKIFQTALTVLVVAVMLSSCATFSRGFPPKESSDDCLVIIKTELDNPDFLPAMRKYFINFSNGYGSQIAFGRNKNYIAVVLKEPAVRIASVSSNVFGENMIGNPTERKFDNFFLPYKAGEIVLLDYAFLVKIEKIADQSYMSGYDFKKMTENDKKELMKELQESDAINSWIPAPTPSSSSETEG